MSCIFVSEENRESSMHSRSDNLEGMYVMWALHEALLRQCVHQRIFQKQWPVAFTMDLSASHQSDEQSTKFKPHLEQKNNITL